jgi:Domain of unknown function (DUF5655)
MQQLGLGYGDANMLALRAKDAAAAKPADADPLDAVHSGPNATLRPIHERLNAALDAMGQHENASKKRCISFRRKKQFATLGPATKTAIEYGLNATDLQASAQLKALPSGAMCQYTVRLSAAAEVDAELMAWVMSAYAAAASSCP